MADDALDETLLQQSRLFQLPTPNKCDLKVLRKWYTDPDCGAKFMPLPESNAWDEDVTDDLVALSERKAEGGSFTQWATDNIISNSIDGSGIDQ